MRTKRLGAAGWGLVAITLAITGCGTTVPLSRQSTTAGTGSADLSTGGAGSSSGGGPGVGASGGGASGPVGGVASAGGVTSAGQGAPAGSASGAAPDNAVSTGVPTTAAGVSSPSGGASVPGDGPGVTGSTIYVGALDNPQAATEDSALGAAGANPGNIKVETKAVVDYVNAHGGVDHHQVSVVYYEENSADTADTTYQDACAQWTQDNKVFVMVSGAPILDQCAARNHILGISEGQIANETTPTLQQFPSDVNIDTFTVDREERYTIAGLAKQGFFSRGAKVGIATWDGSDYHYSITNSVDPALSAIGVNPASVPVSYIAESQSEGDAGSTSASIANAVLNFESKGIDHVILFDGTAGAFGSGILVLLWMQEANTQHYYPKYGLNSTSGFNALASDLPQQEIQNAEGISWLPALDMTSSDFEALPQNQDQKLCLKIMAAAGQGQSTANAQINQFGICETLFFLQYAFGKVPGALNQQSALAAIDSIGSSWQPLTTFATYFSASQHDAADEVADMAWNTSCTCFRYTGAAYKLG